MFGFSSERCWPGRLAGLLLGVIGLSAINCAAANLSALIIHKTRRHVPARVSATSFVPVARHWRNPRLGWPPEIRHLLPSPTGYGLSIVVVASSMRLTRTP